MNDGETRGERRCGQGRNEKEVRDVREAEKKKKRYISSFANSKSKSIAAATTAVDLS